MVEFVTFCHDVKEVRPATSSDAMLSVQPVAAKAKCLVWDLTTQLARNPSGGRTGGSVLNPAGKTIIEELDRRGILHSVASKNDPEPALAALEAFGLREYFLYPQFGWIPKSTSIKQIAALLDIGLDTFVFLDDQAFERGEVGERLRQVTVLSDADLPTLLEHPLFEVPITVESANRRSMYLAEQLRKSTFESTEGDYIEFLRNCSICVDVSILSGAQVERAFELSQRTNQLNVSGRRYSRSELTAFQRPGSPVVAYLFNCHDRFGEYGTIAMCVLNERLAQIESFMMSCRVQRKCLEQAIFAWLVRKCATAGFDTISITYSKTKRNDASVRMLEELGFSLFPDGPNAGVFMRPTSIQIADADVVIMQDLTESAGGVHAA